MEERAFFGSWIQLLLNCLAAALYIFSLIFYHIVVFFFLFLFWMSIILLLIKKSIILLYSKTFSPQFQGPGGVTVKKTSQALIIGIYDEPMTPGQCNMIVERLGDYLIDQGL